MYKGIYIIIGLVILGMCASRAFCQETNKTIEIKVQKGDEASNFSPLSPPTSLIESIRNIIFTGSSDTSSAQNEEEKARIVSIARPSESLPDTTLVPAVCMDDIKQLLGS